MEQSKKPASLAKKMGWAGIALCGLCCTLPIIGAAVGMASITALAVYLEKIAIVALGIGAFFFWYAWYNKKKKAKACSATCDTNCECKPENSTEIK